MTTLNFILLLIILSGCIHQDCEYSQKDFEFTKKEIGLFAAYKVGDTIYFESNKGHRDTFVVTGFGIEQRKDCGGLITVPPINSKLFQIKYLSKNKVDTASHELFFAITRHPTFKQKVAYSIYFKDFYTNPSSDSVLGEFRTDTIKLNNGFLTNYYLVNHGYPHRVVDSDDIAIVYWTEINGLTAYKSKSGEIWTKKSSR